MKDAGFGCDAEREWSKSPTDLCGEMGILSNTRTNCRTPPMAGNKASVHVPCFEERISHLKAYMHVKTHHCHSQETVLLS